MGCPPTVNNFLCCITLETGGLIIGWINLILSFLVLVGSIITLSLISIGHEQIDNNDPWLGSFVAFVIFLSLFIIYYLVSFIASLMLIQAVRKRDHSRMVLFMILMAIGVILQFIQVLAAGWATFFSALFFALLSAYWFICIYSLYDKLRGGTMTAYA